MTAIEKIVDGVVNELLNRKSGLKSGFLGSFDDFNADALIKGVSSPEAIEERKKEDEVYRAVIKKPSDPPVTQKKTVINSVEEVNNQIKITNDKVSSIEATIHRIILENQESEKETEELINEAQLAEEERVQIAETRHISTMKAIKKNAPKNLLKLITDNLPAILLATGIFVAFKDEIVKILQPILNKAVAWLDSNFPKLMNGIRNVFTAIRSVWNGVQTVIGWMGKLWAGLTWVGSKVGNIVESIFDPNGFGRKEDEWAASHANLLSDAGVKAMSDKEIDEAIKEIQSHASEYETGSTADAQSFYSGIFGQSLRRLQHEKETRDAEWESTKQDQQEKFQNYQNYLYKLEEHSKYLSGDANAVPTMSLADKVWPQLSPEVVGDNPNLQIYKEGNVPEGYTPGPTMTESDFGLVGDRQDYHSKREEEGKQEVGVAVQNEIVENTTYVSAMDSFNIQL